MATRELEATARLFGRLLLREIDEPLLRELRSPPLADALHGLGVDVPAGSAMEVVDQLAASYFAHFIAPAHHAPPIQSLWEAGTYDGAPSAQVRACAEAAGVSYEADVARGAPVDHLGSELCLWAELVARDPEAAAQFGTRHLGWAVAPLRSMAAAGEGFYARVAGACADLIPELV